MRPAYLRRSGCPPKPARPPGCRLEAGVPCVALRAEVAALAMRTSATLQTHQERPMSERLRVPCWQVSADRVSYRYGYRDRRWDTPEGRGAARGGSADPSGEANRSEEHTSELQSPC